jgi:cytokinesis protein
MDSLFGRKKARPRQSSVSVAGSDLNERSVPYDKLAPPPRSPIPVGTVSQGLRGTSFISAPITNPTLTQNGTELNKYAMQRSKAGRERAYEEQSMKRPGSPSTSVSTADSSTLYNESIASSASRPYTPQTSRIRRSEASSSSSGRRSPSLADFGQFPPSRGGGSFLPSGSGNATIRPMSGMTSRSESNRGSKYASSLASAEGTSNHSHLSHFYHHNRHNHDDFYFPRPDNDDQIEALFENVKRTRDLGDMPNMPIEQKWHMVYNDEHIRWKEERARDEQSKRQSESGQPAAIVDGSPEWYVKKFLDKTVTPKQAGSLLVSLRSKELRYGQSGNIYRARLIFL